MPSSSIAIATATLTICTPVLPISQMHAREYPQCNLLRGYVLPWYTCLLLPLLLLTLASPSYKYVPYYGCQVCTLSYLISSSSSVNLPSPRFLKPQPGPLQLECTTMDHDAHDIPHFIFYIYIQVQDLCPICKTKYIAKSEVAKYFSPFCVDPPKTYDIVGM